MEFKKKKNLKVERYKNPTSIKGVKPVRIRLRDYSLYTTIENVKGQSHRQTAKDFSDGLGLDVVYRTKQGWGGTTDLEIWVKTA